MLTLAATLSTGLNPGAPAYSVLFSEEGVFSSLCEGPSQLHGCKASSQAVSASFQVGMLVSLLGLFPVGLAFDYLGGQIVGALGAAICVSGMLLLQVALLGVQLGMDSWTSACFPIAVLVADTGGLLNSYSMMSLLWHFPDLQTFVISVMGATSSVGGVLPNIMKYFMRTAGLSLSQAFLLYILGVACSGIGCYHLAYSLEEYRAQAKKVLGLPLPKPPQKLKLRKTVRNAHEVLRFHWNDHMFMIAAFAPWMAVCTVYATSIGDYATELFKDKDAGDTMASLYVNINAGLTVLLSPILSMLGDTVGDALKMFIVILAILPPTFTFIVARATWSAQCAVSICCAVSLSAMSLLVQKYTLAYAMPSQVGAVMGVLFTYAVVISIVIMCVFNTIIVDSSLAVQYTVLSFIASVTMTVFCVRAVFVVGFPDTPVLLPSDETELADPFGCKDFNEVAYVTHKSRDEVLKILCSTAGEDMAGLIQSIDYDRMQEKISDNTEQPEGVGKDSMKPTGASSSHVHTSPTACTVQESSQSPSSLRSTPSRNSNSGHLRTGNTTGTTTKTDLSTVPGPEKPSAAVVEGVMGVQRPRRVNSRRLLWFGGHSTPCVWVDAPHIMSQPLLGGHSPVIPPEETPAAQARAVNEKLVVAMRAGDKAKALAIYREEDPEVLWQAYQDLFDSVPDMDLFQKQWDELVPDDELEEVIKKRPELKVTAMKMVALRTKKRVFG